MSLSENHAPGVGEGAEERDEGEEEEEEEDPYESIYEEVGPPDRGGDDDDQFYGSESDFDEIPDDDVKVQYCSRTLHTDSIHGPSKLCSLDSCATLMRELTEPVGKLMKLS